MFRFLTKEGRAFNKALREYKVVSRKRNECYKNNNRKHGNISEAELAEWKATDVIYEMIDPLFKKGNAVNLNINDVMRMIHPEFRRKCRFGFGRR